MDLMTFYFLMVLACWSLPYAEPTRIGHHNAKPLPRVLIRLRKRKGYSIEVGAFDFFQARNPGSIFTGLYRPMVG